ncbi:hypothetical protein NUW58_g6491 [Xylaria curta]|uniref:Uncharacterized protein n=1 Tax=Xylaria curta TaxID=42375 RepID=A0ACC1NUX8_9PEZI|nr:hypothetical protein NUW58_g6491 [Xylaria curta]
MYLENSTIGDALQYERLQALKSEEEPSFMEYPSSTASPFFSFGCSSTASSPESAFSFSPEVDTNMAVADFSEHWSSPNYPSVLMSQIGTDQAYTRSPQPIFCTDFGRNTMSWLAEDPNDGVDIILGSSFHDKFQAQDHQKKGETKPSTDNRSAQAECGSTISTILPSASTPQPGKSRGKRSLPGDSTDDGGDQSQPTNCGRVPRDSGGGKPLACPFHKKDPQQYQDCGKYLLRRIKDVKQHIYRLHCKPELNCPRCFQSFKCADERDHHIRKGGCTLKDVPILDSIISEEQKKKLKDCGSRGTSKHQQWMELWSVIFPGAKPPRSPHIDNGQEELLSCLRSYWDENASEIIAKSLGENDLESPNFTGIREVVDSILNHFEAKPTDWDLKNNGKTGVAPQPSPVHGVTVEDTPNHLSLQDPDQLSEIDFASYTLTANSPDSFSPDDWASPIAMG